MNAVDLVSGAYVVYGALRGLKRGLADEAYRLIRVGVALVAGCGLYDWLSQGLESLLNLAPGISDTTGFIATFAGAFAALRLGRRKLTEWIRAKAGPRVEALGGSVAGLFRAGVALTALMTALHLSPADTRSADESWIGKIAGVFSRDAGHQEPVSEHE